MKYVTEESTRREQDAVVMREAAYSATVCELRAGAIQMERAVINLRHAYRRAARFAAGRPVEVAHG